MPRRKKMNIIEKIKEKFKEIFSKTKKGVALGGTIAALGLTTACGTDKEADMLNQNAKVEQGIKENNFKEEVKVNQSELQTVENEIKALETKEEVLQYLKNMYIEQYEAMTGDTDLTTENIELWCKRYLKMVYVNKETGEMFYYGSDYKKEEQKLEEEGIPYDIEEDVGVYTVVYTEKNEMNVIDCVSLQSKERKTVPVKVTMNEQVGKPYTSVLATMGTAIPDGLDHIEYLEKGNENDIAVSKKNFIEAVEKFENEKQKLQVGDVLKNEETEGGYHFEKKEINGKDGYVYTNENPEEGFEHE